MKKFIKVIGIGTIVGGVIYVGNKALKKHKVKLIKKAEELVQDFCYNQGMFLESMDKSIMDDPDVYFKNLETIVEEYNAFFEKHKDLLKKDYPTKLILPNKDYMEV